MDANRRDNPFLAPLAFLAVGSLTGETFAGKLALMGRSPGNSLDLPHSLPAYPVRS